MHVACRYLMIVVAARHSLRVSHSQAGRPPEAVVPPVANHDPDCFGRQGPRARGHLVACNRRRSEELHSPPAYFVGCGPGPPMPPPLRLESESLRPGGSAAVAPSPTRSRYRYLRRPAGRCHGGNWLNGSSTGKARAPGAFKLLRDRTHRSLTASLALLAVLGAGVTPVVTGNNSAPAF